MRQLFILFAILIATSYAWQPRVSPPANQLERLATGTDLYLVCQVSEEEVGSSNVELLWYKDGKAMTKQKIRKNGYIQASLAFVKPNKGESGNYTCKATIGDESKEETVPVEFFERAGFVASEASIHPQEGENAKITCETRGDRLDEIFWLKNGYQLSEADERGYQFEDDYRTLIIPDFFGEKDDGNYSCNVVQFAQIYTKDIEVTAYSRPVITVFQVPENNAGFEGSSAIFKCSASGKPSPKYKWFKTDDDDSLVELDNADKYKIDDGLLGVNHLVDSDAGLYTCLAENEVGSSKQNATLIIHRRPKIERMEDVTTVLGNSVELVCSINSDSNITDAYFTFNKQRYAPHSKDTVSYETVTEEPEMEETTADESSEEGTATAGTSVSGEEDNNDDEEEVVESRKRRGIIDNTINVEWRDDKLVLTIPNAQMSHMGKYSCHAENMAGSTYDSAKILINHAPVFTNVSERFIRRQEAESAFLFCEVSAIPNAEMAFERGSSPVYPDGVNVQLESTNDKLALTFNSLQDADFGTYRCTAKNTQGSAEPAVFELIKIIPPKDPEAISCADNVYPNFAVCRLDGYEETKRGEWPTRFQVYYVTEVPTEDFDWENSATVTEAKFTDGKTLKLTGLNTEQKYFARIRAVNEAGEGELSEVIPFETTAAWTPEPVVDADINCPDVCSVNWTTPNDRGAEITGYKLVFRETSAVKAVSEESEATTELAETIEVTTTECEGDCDKENTTSDDSIEEELEDEEEDTREQITINVGPHDHHVDLPQLLPLRNYELTIYAINEVGLSEPTTYYFRTTEKSGLATLFPLPNWAIITLFIIVGLVLAIMLDAFCCKTRHCGVLACLTSHCRNRRNRTPKDIEQGTASGEHRVLITTTEKQIIRNDH